MDPTTEQEVRNIELEFERVIYQQSINARDLHDLKVRLFEHPGIAENFVIQAHMLLAGEVLDGASFSYPANWKSGCWAALASHWRMKGWTRLANWAHKKVRLKRHNWKVRREWLDERPIEGRRMKVIAYFDDKPLLGSGSEARRDFLEKYAELRYTLLQSQLPVGTVAKLIYDVLTTAERVPWRFVLRDVGADENARNH